MQEVFCLLPRKTIVHSLLCFSHNAGEVFRRYLQTWWSLSILPRCFLTHVIQQGDLLASFLWWASSVIHCAVQANPAPHGLPYTMTRKVDFDTRGHELHWTCGRRAMGGCLGWQHWVSIHIPWGSVAQPEDGWAPGLVVLWLHKLEVTLGSSFWLFLLPYQFSVCWLWDSGLAFHHEVC